MVGWSVKQVWPPSSSVVQFHFHAKAKRLSSSSSSSSWRGLDKWRKSPLNENRFWGANGPQPEPPRTADTATVSIENASSLAELGTIVLSTSDPISKSNLSHLAFSKFRSLNLPVGSSIPPPYPARPPKPSLVRFPYSSSSLPPIQTSIDNLI